MRVPDHRAIAISNGEAANGPLEQGLKNLLDGQDAPGEVDYAYSIYVDPYKSEVIEAFLLANGSAEDIKNTLRIPGAVVTAYQHLFFDRAVFRDELDVEAYAQTYPAETKEEKWGRELKISAVSLGLEYLIYRFAHKDPDIDLVGSLKAIISNAYMLTKATRINPLDSDAARESRQWATMAVKAMETYTRVKPLAEKTDDAWQVALETIEHTTNEAKSGIKADDILH